MCHTYHGYIDSVLKILICIIFHTLWAELGLLYVDLVLAPLVISCCFEEQLLSHYVSLSAWLVRILLELPTLKWQNSNFNVLLPLFFEIFCYSCFFYLFPNHWGTFDETIFLRSFLFIRCITISVKNTFTCVYCWLWCVTKSSIYNFILIFIIHL